MVSADPGETVFDLSGHAGAKADPAAVAVDEQHLELVRTALVHRMARLGEQLTARRREPATAGQAALQRDLEIHRLTAELRLLRRQGLDVCLGRVVGADGEDVWVGRLGLTDEHGRRLLVDWRTPAAEPFFAASHADPRGLAGRRRLRWRHGRVVDYWDEVFDVAAWERVAGPVRTDALDDQSAFVASLGSARSARMQDVLGTIQADQDAIVRASSSGPLVVDGGPGTGKTVVALHRAAYLLHADPRLGRRRGGVLVVGPHRPYLTYTADVLPSLGEEGVQTCTLADLVAEGADAGPEPDPEVARLKASLSVLAAVEPAVAMYEEPPTESLLVQTDWADAWLHPTDWATAFAAPDPGTPHHEARDQIWEALLDLLVEQVEPDEEVPAELVRRSMAADPELRRAVSRAWPVLSATDLVGDLWTVPAYLRRCAPELSGEDVARLQRSDPQAWTLSDLPLLDAARERLGDPGASGRRRQREATLAAERAAMDAVVGELISADDDGEGWVTMLRQPRIREMLLDQDALPRHDPDRLAGPFAHVVVDEAQELTDAEWRMLLRRCPSGSLTVVGDRAQARHGFTGSWAERLARVGLGRVRTATLTTNYRTPSEVMAAAEPVIRAVVPDASVPTSIRSSGIPVGHAAAADLDALLARWLAEHPEGTACVIGDDTLPDPVPASERVRSLSPPQVKGLEFDLVVLVPAPGTDLESVVDRYVAMTRATQQLLVLTPAGG